MRKDAHVLIVEEDPFASNWMALLIARDWRTIVASEAGAIDEAVKQLSNRSNRANLILLDSDFVTESNLSKLKVCLSPKTNAQILIIGNTPNADVLRRVVNDPLVVGYILKSETHNSLGWIIDFALDSNWVINPGIQNMAVLFRIQLPENKMILDGRRTINKLTPHEMEVARLGLIFSMERRELANELGVTEDWGYGLVSALYKKLGLEEILSGEVPANAYLGNHPAIIRRVESIIADLGASKKAKDMESLSFHLLTMPEIID